MKYRVLILMGSDSDLPIMEEAGKVFDHFSVGYRMSIASAHRTPERVIKLVREAERNGADVIIAGAGMSAHLAGIVAAHTLLPVIGVPLNSSPLDGLDSLLSTVQMPPGIPVATMAIGKPGARNAAIFALQIMASKDTSVREKLAQFRRDLKKEVEKKDKQLQKR
jgi:phosphoribosylaminoimidazole carboxylase PurE protein